MEKIHETRYMVSTCTVLATLPVFGLPGTQSEANLLWFWVVLGPDTAKVATTTADTMFTYWLSANVVLVMFYYALYVACATSGRTHPVLAHHRTDHTTIFVVKCTYETKHMRSLRWEKRRNMLLQIGVYVTVAESGKAGKRWSGLRRTGIF